MGENKNNKKKIALILLIVLLVGTLVGFGVYKMTSSPKENKLEETIVDDDEIITDENEFSEVEETPTETPKEESEYEKEAKDPANAPSTTFTTISTIDSVANYGGSNVNARLKRWVDIASHFSFSSSTTTIDKFLSGLTYKQLSKSFKFKMAFNAIFYDKKYIEKYELTENDVSKMESVMNKAGMKGETVAVMKVSDFNSEYKGLFQEDTTYTIKELPFTCPISWALDKDSERIFLFNRCGGTGNGGYNTKITSIDSDNNYYYVHQTASFVEQPNNKVKKSYKTLWKFDKNLKFVSTTKE